jgi:hypothetical protein
VWVPEAKRQQLPGYAKGEGGHGAHQCRGSRDRVGHGKPLLRATLQVKCLPCSARADDNEMSVFIKENNEMPVLVPNGSQCDESAHHG